MSEFERMSELRDKIEDLESKLAAAKAEIEKLSKRLGCIETIEIHLEKENKRLREALEEMKCTCESSTRRERDHWTDCDLRIAQSALEGGKA